MMRTALVVAAAAAPWAAAEVPLATFDGAAGTTRDWEPVNDPVMGGKSKSTFAVDKDRQLGLWNGNVAIVPFLGSPGFCNLMSPGLGKKAEFPDLSEMAGIAVRAREAMPEGLTKFEVMLQTNDAKKGSQEGVYGGVFELSSEMKDSFVPWSSFNCTWRGQKVDWCRRDLSTTMKQGGSSKCELLRPGRP
eukprot:TRINITY_DN25326_c1_g1_i4.p2 TRINITY_DN25326_c1_g1~~TRINITY_DN25326_c1_g1_i4.p2  ORF type:complete len:190 (-),score=55.94 TRINITY_DN25326_c1_g1_i4:48-617(-)